MVPLFEQLISSFEGQYRFRFLSYEALTPHDRKITDTLNRKYKFDEWIYFSPTGELISIYMDIKNKRVIKILKENSIYNHEKEILEYLAGKHHTIKLLETYGAEKLRFHALVFEQYYPLEVARTDDIKYFMCQLLEALAYCHSMDIIHRDVKPQNILCKGQGTERVLVLCDFNLAVRASKLCNATPVGTLEYMAPEMFQLIGYNFAVDIWGAGLVAYEWTFGKHPFATNQPKDDEFIQLLQNFCKYTYNNLDWPEEQQFTVLKAMLEPNCFQRIKAQQALEMLHYNNST